MSASLSVGVEMGGPSAEGRWWVAVTGSARLSGELAPLHPAASPVAADAREPAEPALRVTQAVLPPAAAAPWWADLYRAHYGLSPEAHEAELNGEAEEGRIALRHRLRRAAGRVVGGRVAGCGRKRTAQAVTLWRREDGGVCFRGVETCGSIWNCPVCAAKIAEGRRCDLAALIEAATAAGHAAYMLTLTIPHARLDKAAELRRVVAAAWRKVQQGRQWAALRRAFGIVGYVRALEVTHGDGHGWHPHLHVLLTTAEPLDARRMRALHVLIFRRWRRRVAELLPGKPCAFGATDFRPATASDYVAKWGADSEVAKAGSKLGRRGGRSPWQLLADYDLGDRRAGALFAEYAAAFKGARHLTYSRGFREAYGLRDAPADEQLAEEGAEIAPELPLNDGGGVGQIGAFDAPTWDALAGRGLTGGVAEAARADGWRGVELYLRRHGLGSYFEPDELPKPATWRPPRLGWLPIDPEHPKWRRLYG